MADGARTLSVATYNIHRGLGRDRRVDHQRIAQVVLDLDADVVALQEVETPTSLAPGAVVLLHRLHQHGYEAVLGPTMTCSSFSYGNVLLSRLPVERHRRVDLSQPGREPRGLIEASLRLGESRVLWTPGSRGRALACLATHLGLSGWERGRQVVRLADRIDRSSGESTPQTPLILFGDFNEWCPCLGRLSPISMRLQPVPARPTYPGGWPLLPLDRIWFGGGLRLRSQAVVRDGAARLASDHLPLRASFELAGMDE